jgi:diguanylate cyclase (GGDEF)-like protein
MKNDPDYFKDFNDTIGRNMGDLLLQQTSPRLNSCVREGDIVACPGGGEFVAMPEKPGEQPVEAAVQGNLFCKPVPIKRFEEMVRQIAEEKPEVIHVLQ